VTGSPRDVTCPACFAPVGEPCTAPTDTGRRNVAWHHFARTYDASTVNLTKE
jgi:hypothetical protein